MSEPRKLTDRDMALVKYVLEDGMDKYKAAELAGFSCSSKSAFVNAANASLRKFEENMTNSAVFRTTGVSESYLAQQLRKIIDEGSNADKLKAIDIAAKCLGLYQGALAVGGAIIQINAPSMRAPDIVDGQKAEDSTIEVECVTIIK